MSTLMESRMPQQVIGRVHGKVLATFPDRGFFWVLSDAGVKHFAHQTKVQNGFPIYDMWEGQECTFVSKDDDPRGCRAESIEMLDRA